MSYCNKHRHLATQDAMSGRCQECEIAALHERAERVEAGYERRRVELDQQYAELKELAAALVEAREDIEALATICQALGKRRIIACAARTEGDWHAWQRIRDRKLMEQEVSK